mmetsp:Transcript_119721/g.211638  ORF Transcript_119721/g.211638 Transcript_119721/m.211638 type:complete len:350 (-) Transcript_119721:63-1112(-)
MTLGCHVLRRYIALAIVITVSGNVSHIEADVCEASVQDSSRSFALLQVAQSTSRNATLSGMREAVSVRENSTFGSIHEVVGNDGVLVISLERKPERFEYVASKLATAGIRAVKFPATDVADASWMELDRGCLSSDHPDVMRMCKDNFDKRGAWGCSEKVVQAIAESHRRALMAAQQRDSQWTAILEDDVVPVNPERWDQAFKKAWSKIPPESKIVRLSWCMIVEKPRDTMRIYADTGDFVLAKWVGLDDATYHPGLCTGGYVVHKSIIPELLSLFPCCSAVDTCYFDLAQRTVDASGESWGMEVMISMQARESRDVIEKITSDPWLAQHGVMYQDRGVMLSAREDWSES